MKKSVCLLLCLLMLLSVLSVQSFAQTVTLDDSYTLGDADGNGECNALDSLLIKSFVAGVGICDPALDTPAVPDKNAADLDADGKITSKDAFYLKAAFAGKLTVDELESEANLETFVIGGCNISEFTIEVPADTDDEEDNVAFAAKELTKYIKTATGVSLTTVKGDSGSDHAIVFHSVSLDSELGKELGYDGYKMSFDGSDLNIYGTLRGNMYCVYDILEKYIGYSFYSDEDTFLWEQRYSEIPATVDVTKIPKLFFRFTRQSFGDFKSHFLPKKMNGTQIYSHESDYYYGTLTGPHFINAHSYGYYWRMATGYQKDLEEGKTVAELMEDLHESYNHGEQKQEAGYSAIKAWQPCASTESDYNNLFLGLVLTMRMIQDWGHTFIDGISCMSFSICDNIEGYCPCRICSAKANGTSTQINGNKEAVEKLLKNYGGEYTIGDTVRNKTSVSFTKECYSGVYVDLTNRGAYDITHEENAAYTGEWDIADTCTYYPGMKLMTIIYDLTIPESIRPASNIIIMFCGQGCNNHALGTDGCGDNHGRLGENFTNNGEKGSNKAIKSWCDFCHASGAQFWFWYYPVTYVCVMAPTPNMTNIYYDLYWIINEAGADGVYYEGGGEIYTFENLKAHIGSTIMWDTDMTYEEFEKLCLDYMYAYYGKGYEKVFDYMMLQDEAGRRSTHCYVNNNGYPFEMYDFDFLAEHYIEMRGLIIDAMKMTSNEKQKKRLETLLATCDTLGLEAVYDDWYTDGTNVELYKSYYDTFVSIVQKYNMNFGFDKTVTPGEYDTRVFDQVAYTW